MKEHCSDGKIQPNDVTKGLNNDGETQPIGVTTVLINGGKKHSNDFTNERLELHISVEQKPN
jgi:hypothetical protein